VPKARTPRMWVTVLVSHPSVSIETETTQRTCSPSRPGLPTVFMTSRSRSSSVIFSAALWPERWANAVLNASISGRAKLRNSVDTASPESSSVESISKVNGRANRRLSGS